MTRAPAPTANAVRRGEEDRRLMDVFRVRPQNMEEFRDNASRLSPELAVAFRASRQLAFM
jgi:hypothetical protein